MKNTTIQWILGILLIASMFSVQAAGTTYTDSKFGFKINVPAGWQQNHYDDGQDRMFAMVSPDENVAIRVRAVALGQTVSLDVLRQLYEQYSIPGAQFAGSEQGDLNGLQGLIAGYRWSYNNTPVIVGAFLGIENNVAYFVSSIIPELLFQARTPEADSITNTFHTRSKGIVAAPSGGMASILSQPAKPVAPVKQQPKTTPPSWGGAKSNVQATQSNTPKTTSGTTGWGNKSAATSSSSGWGTKPVAKSTNSGWGASTGIGQGSCLTPVSGPKGANIHDKDGMFLKFHYSGEWVMEHQDGIMVRLILQRRERGDIPRPIVVVQNVTDPGYQSVEDVAKDLKQQAQHSENMKSAVLRTEGKCTLQNFSQNGKQMQGYQIVTDFKLNGLPFIQHNLIFKRQDVNGYHTLMLVAHHDEWNQATKAFTEIAQSAEVKPLN